MKNSLLLPLFLLLLLLPGRILTQDNTKSAEASKYPRQLPTFNIFNVDTLTISAKVTAYDQYEISIDNTKDQNEAKTWSLKPFTLESFKKTFEKYIMEAEPKAKDTGVEEGEIKRLFYILKSSDITIAELEEKPEAGKLCFNKDVSVRKFNLTKFTSAKKRAKLKLKSLQIDKATTDQIGGKSSKKYYQIGTEVLVRSAAIERLVRMESVNEERTRQDSFVAATKSLDSIKALYLQTKNRIAAVNQEIKAESDNKTSYQKELAAKRKEIADLDRKINAIASDIVVWSEVIGAEAEEVEKILEAEKLSDYEDKVRGFEKQIKDAWSLKANEINVKNNDIAVLQNSVANYQAQIEALDTRLEIPEVNASQDSIRNIRVNKAKIEESKNDTELKIEDDQRTLEGLQQNKEDLTKLRDSLKKHNDLRILKLPKLNRELRARKGTITRSENKIKKIRKDSLEDLLNPLLKGQEGALILANKRSILAQNNLMTTDFEVESIQIEFNKGFIENILVLGDVIYTAPTQDIQKILDSNYQTSKKKVKFENLSPIGFSRKIDFNDAKDRVLYTRGGPGAQYQINLEDILTIYVQNHEVNRRDFSPTNVTEHYKRVDESNCLTLFKEATYKIIEATIYTDFVGLDESEPNGLVQTEVTKNIPLITSRSVWQKFPTWLHRRITGGKGVEAWNAGFLAHFEPFLTLSKIEEDERTLNLLTRDKFINQIYTPVKFASTLSLKQFQNFETGFDLNMFLLDVPSFKSTFFLDLGIRYGRTAIVDSVRVFDGINVQNNGLTNDFGVNTFEVSSEATWNIKSDERYEFYLTWRHNWFYLRDTRFEQVANAEAFATNETNTDRFEQYNTIQLLAKFRTSKNAPGKLFFRYRHHWQQDFWRTGFHQAQVGYSFYLLGRYK